MTEPAPSRIRPLVAAAILLIVAVALALVLAAAEHLVLPVTVDFPGPRPRMRLASVDVGAAAVVLCVLAAAFRLVETRRRPSRDRRLVEYGLVAPITVFLVARLNGVEDVGALVLVYASSSAMVLFAMLQDRVEVRRGHPMLALCFGAAVGIVPWGVIAFHQVGAGVVGEYVPPGVRLITLVMLAFAAAFAVTQWRELRPPRSGAGERTHVVLVTVSTAVLALLVLIGLLLPPALS